MPEHDARILLVEDEAEQRELLAAALGDAGLAVTAVGNGEAALDLLAIERFDVLVTDQRLPGIDGVRLLARARAALPDLDAVLITAYGSIPDAVQAMRSGGHDYLTKPFEAAHLVDVLHRLLRARGEHRGEPTADAHAEVGLIGASPAMAELRRTIARVARSDLPVLVRGESGTGKELVARAIHALGRRREAPLIAVNCAAVPAELLESEFFGHEKGAFSGAAAARPGLFEQADRGTLLLDEIGAMRAELQAKLLRVLESCRVRRVGGDRERAVDARVIAATGADLEAAIAAGTFRADLLYRLAVLTLRVPPLRERAGDVPLLIEHFARAATRRAGRPPIAFTRAALERLSSHPWPGNVRELRNVVEQVVALTPGERCDAADLPVQVLGRASPGAGAHGFALPDTGVRLAEVERSLIAQALRRSGGRLAGAARLLGISYKTLQYRCRKHGLRAPLEHAAPNGADDPI
jgi:DNA-binding NtrC family response regulator